MQTIGRSARNVDARVILYADTITDSMAQAVAETRRRRGIQEAYNREHGITPETVRKEIRAGIEAESAARAVAYESVRSDDEGDGGEKARKRMELLEQLEADMMAAAAELDFERAASIRDTIASLREGKAASGRRGRGGAEGGKAAQRGSMRIPRPRRM